MHLDLARSRDAPIADQHRPIDWFAHDQPVQLRRRLVHVLYLQYAEFVHLGDDLGE